MAFRLSDPLGSTKSNLLRLTWEKLAPLPGGKALYSAFVGRMAPYTGSIGAKVEGEYSVVIRPALLAGVQKPVRQQRPLALVATSPRPSMT